jgi:hypothetical protein
MRRYRSFIVDMACVPHGCTSGPGMSVRPFAVSSAYTTRGSLPFTVAI